jgi:inorganic pyrophosphatase
VRGYIVGGLMMHDEKGPDEKIFVVPEDELEEYLRKPDSEKKFAQDNIIWFFSNYKKHDVGKWSKVDSLLTCEEAVEIYKTSKNAFLGV